jgi:hypothetical protein
MNPTPLIIVWGILGLILVVYVAYRFTTDKAGNDKRHMLYPLVSNPTDPTLPTSKLALLCYLFMLAGIAGVILQLINETGMFTITPLALNSLQACIPVGVILFIILKVKSCENNNT